MALLRALHAIGPGAGLSLSVAHMDHGARPESADDARFVAGLAEALGRPVDLGRWQPERPAHFEADARRARLAWLAEVATARGAAVVATGHTRDDQAETILHRVLRGTGPRGLAGIPRARRLAEGVTLVRPLLCVGREDLRDYLRRLNQTWRDDPTNGDTVRTRARIRHEILPRLARDFNPEIAAALARLGDLARGATRAIDGLASRLADEATLARSEDSVTLDRAHLAALAPFVRAELIRTAWRRVGWPEGGMDAARWRRIAAWAARGSGARDAGAGVVIRVEGDDVTLSRSPVAAPAAPPPGPEPLPIPGEARRGDGRVVASLDEAAPADERLDFDRLVPPLSVDGPRPGDRFDPLGMDGRSMPLADFLRGRRVAKADRGRVVLVRDAVGIVWVVGHRVGHRARLTGETARMVGLRWETSEPFLSPP